MRYLCPPVAIEQPWKTVIIVFLFSSLSNFSHLCVIHHHLRAGGVRRIIELALPHLVKESSIRRVTLAVGESNDPRWIEALRKSLGAIPLQVVCTPAFRYLPDKPPAVDVLRRRIARTLTQLAPVPEETLFWMHNPGLARNLILTDELRRFSAGCGVPAVFHHHDFWFENRWSRWPGLRAAGFRTVDAVAEAIYGAGAPIVHATINRCDAAFFERRRTGAWMPNLTSRQKPCPAAERDAARRWLTDKLGDAGPVWLFPTRFLRRKNLAESVLVTRWLQPEGWLVTTAGVSSAEEAGYARRLENAARRGGWRARFRMLEHEDGHAPSIPALLAAAEAVVMTSAQEGFGLPYLEAVASGRPLVARRLPNVVPDLEAFGFQLPWLYDEIWIDPALLDEKKERARQRAAWTAWRRQIPTSVQKQTGRPAVLERSVGNLLPFSRLTLDGQLEVLAHPADESWALCRRANPDLARWKTSVAAGRFDRASWPREADAQIGGPAYAQRFWTAIGCPPDPLSASACRALQQAFIRERLGSGHLYPILFSP
jgi:glycosyltransferase involved in cell wall biosynthesis